MCVYQDTQTVRGCAQPPTGIDISLHQLSNLENERKEVLEGRMACSKDEWCSVFCTESTHAFVCVCVLVCVLIVGPDPIYGESLPHSLGPAVTSLGVCGGNGTLVQKLVTRSQRPPGPAHTDTTSVQYRLHYRSGIK